MSTPLFSLLHVTARLPEGWLHAMRAWRDRCDDPSRVEYLLCVDQGRTSELRDIRNTAAWGYFDVIVNPNRRCAVDAWNWVASKSKGDVLITVADDYFCPEHWDTDILHAVQKLYGYRNTASWGEFVLDVDNQDNSYPLLPFSFISRAYYERLGYLFWPEYFGIGADSDFTAVARRDGVVIDARHLKFEHRHWTRGTRVYDDVDAHQQCREAEILHHTVLARRKAEGFPPLPVGARVII
jgi:hypothetical protein